ncbi:hypothetical protein BpHYR1_013269 [Brachionus plicatilis]|uniref:Uncharacterized protein n=1 Tax=Brachionus plicatilis TaxID=10195 RepID=A0A3M7SQR0_BRAPC|nr:hypothetical protein BpHYR1_013269 [Brachionus plicatilis]
MRVIRSRPMDDTWDRLSSWADCWLAASGSRLCAESSSRVQPSASSTALSLATIGCSCHFSPASLLSTTISRSRPRSDANLQPCGPISRTRAAKDSLSLSGGATASFSLRTNRHVIRVGMLARFGGIMTRTPLCRQPFMAPPLASTIKLIRKLAK